MHFLNTFKSLYLFAKNEWLWIKFLTGILHNLSKALYFLKWDGDFGPSGLLFALLNKNGFNMWLQTSRSSDVWYLLCYCSESILDRTQSPERRILKILMNSSFPAFSSFSNMIYALTVATQLYTGWITKGGQLVTGEWEGGKEEIYLEDLSYFLCSDLIFSQNIWIRESGDAEKEDKSKTEEFFLLKGTPHVDLRASLFPTFSFCQKKILSQNWRLILHPEAFPFITSWEMSVVFCHSNKCENCCVLPRGNPKFVAKYWKSHHI